MELIPMILVALTLIGYFGILLCVIERWFVGGILFAILMFCPIVYRIRHPNHPVEPTVIHVIIHHTNETINPK
jgi:hypothetical protein